jgi:hypothetical protein
MTASIARHVQASMGTSSDDAEEKHKRTEKWIHGKRFFRGGVESQSHE